MHNQLHLGNSRRNGQHIRKVKSGDRAKTSDKDERRFTRLTCYDLWFGDSGTNRKEGRWQMLRFPLGDTG